MPLVGLGLWKIPANETADKVYSALSQGYRLLDGAYDYRNSAEAGQGLRRAISDGIVKRDEVFVTSKLWNNYHKRQHALDMANREVETWGLDYLDLYLIHFPISLKYVEPEKQRYPTWWSDEGRTKVMERIDVPVSETWAALASLVQDKASNSGGIFRSIGVANFTKPMLEDLIKTAKEEQTPPVSVLQIEHHPYLTQPDLIKTAQANNVAVTAYSSFGPASFLELGNKDAKSVESLFKHDIITKIAGKHSRTPAQVLLRWATQRDVAVIPKSNNPERLQENLMCSDFDLAPEEIEQISGLERNLRFNDPGKTDPSLSIFD
jgi:D-xylose reductase